MKIKPLGDRVLVEQMEAEEVSRGGILLPDTAKEKPAEGKVVAVGAGKRADDGTLIPVNIKIGDKVIYSKYGGNEISTSDGKEYLVVREDDIYAIVS
ncbi:MAG: chaperonin GroES [Lysobacterales bacterium]